MTDRNETAIRTNAAVTEWRPAEGVRLIDAEEAQRVLDAGHATGRGSEPLAPVRRRPVERARDAAAASGPSSETRLPPAPPPPPAQLPFGVGAHRESGTNSGSGTLGRDRPLAGASPGSGGRGGQTRPAPPAASRLSWGPPLHGGEANGGAANGGAENGGEANGGAANGGAANGGGGEGDAVDEHADTDAFAYAAPAGTVEGPAPRRMASPEARITVSGGQVLPHWTEPVDDGDSRLVAAGDGRESAGYSGARWRNDHGDWDDLDAGGDIFADVDEEPRLGALDTDRSDRSDLYSFDEAFQQLQEERSGSHPAVLVDDPDEALSRPPEPGRTSRLRTTSRRRLRPDATTGATAATAVPTPSTGGSTAAGRRFRRRRPTGADGVRPDTGAAQPGGDLQGADPTGIPRGAGSSRLRGRAARSSDARSSDDRSGEDRSGEARGRAARGRPLTGSTALRRGADGGGTPEGGASAAGSKPRRRGSALGSRLVVGVALVALLVAAYVVGPEALVVLAAAVVLLCAAEAYAMLQRSGFRPATLLGLAATGGLMFAAYWRGEPALPLVAVLAFAATMVWYLLGITDARPLANVAVTSMTVLWVGLLGSFAALLLRVPNGKGLFLGAVVVTVAADIVAYFGGRQWGRHPLAPKVSPGKTVEGFAAGAAAAVVAGLVIGEWVSPWGGLYHGLLLGVAVAIFAPVGDLFESLIKRDLEVKDSGTVLAGHGGLLDRFDSLLLVLPATYYLADYLHLVK